eukprot:1131808-Pleurochrysis_carterae.AAC.2
MSPVFNNSSHAQAKSALAYISDHILDACVRLQRSTRARVSAEACEFVSAHTSTPPPSHGGLEAAMNTEKLVSTKKCCTSDAVSKVTQLSSYIKVDARAKINRDLTKRK